MSGDQQDQGFVAQPLPLLTEREWSTLIYSIRHYEASLRDEEREHGPYTGPLETASEVAALGNKFLRAKHAKARAVAPQPPHEG